LYLYYLKQFWV